MQTQVKPIHSSPARRCLAARPPLFVALLLACAASAAAQQSLTFAAAAERGQTIFEQSAVTGMVLVAVRGNDVMIKGYGETLPGSGHVPDSHSFLRLCSLSKVFTTDLLLKLASDGKVKLTDPLESYAPHGKLVPEGIDGNQITLLDLATHTAGLPREVSSYPAKTPHFTFPSYVIRWSWLPGQRLKTPPGTAALYSNIGFDLLGDALAKASGESYAQLLHKRLLQPLDMWDTTLYPTPGQCVRLMQPSKDQGVCTDTEASGPSGGVYSTAADMVKLLQYLLHVPGSPAQPAGALDVYLRPQQLKSIQGLSHAGDPTGIGLAWIQIGGPNTPSALMEKTGGGAGFTTYIALSPSRQTGIFLAATWGKGDAKIDFFHEANNLLAALANIPPLPPKVHRSPPARKHSKRLRRPGANVRSKS
ncbi:MAG TPA: D-alanyl-D-alanine-carboxypeptidase/endopeptidase AmpH [Terracidiphilus sp.]|nr:D-alanyl-D-alanine-carboxypeptidase/endopeptidase AmpH [Terracidiphilus sp.]